LAKDVFQLVTFHTRVGKHTTLGRLRTRLFCREKRLFSFTAFILVNNLILCQLIKELS